MTSERLVLAVSLLGLVGTGCRREQRRPSDPETLSPGPSPYANNAWAASEGQRLYAQMNCSGCHFHGGGGMGPPLMDGAWIYGSDEQSVFDSIAQGRLNGMPPFRARLTDAQIWQLVEYVRALSGLGRMDVPATRDDHMSVREPLSRTRPQPQVKDPR